MTAALLGLYEMMVATEVYPDAHSAHIRGVSAYCAQETYILICYQDYVCSCALISYFSAVPHRTLKRLVCFRCSLALSWS